MKKLILFILIVFVGNSSFAQLPYLNASTGNAGEFPVDKDTNLYMFHGNRLVKTDKNFNTIWANTYGNLEFKHVLLSKTGSMFFIAGNSIGKIEKNGTLAWCKDLNTISAVINSSANVTYTTSQINSLLLDHNNHLIITAHTNASTNSPPAYYLKLDTLGTQLKLALFKGNLLKNFSIVNDSLGYYRFFGGGGPAMLSGVYSFGFTVFNDVSNNFTSGFVYGVIDTQAWESYSLIRSQFNSGFYVRLIINYNYNLFHKASVLKCDLKGNLKWGLVFDNCLNSTLPMWGHLRSIIEDNSGNLFLQVAPPYPYTYGVLKVDSNGVTNNSAIITHTFNTYNNPIQYFSVQKRAGDDLYTHFVATGYPVSPLTINMFKSNFSSTCYSTSACNSFGNGAPPQTLPTPTLQMVTSYSINNQNITSNTTTFTANTFTCMLNVNIGIKENNLNNGLFKIFPNPSNNKLNITSNSNAIISEVQITDVNGKVIKTFNNESELEINELNAGIYFLNITSDGRKYHQKFIKE